MSNFDRRYKGEDTHTLEGTSFFSGAVILAMVILGGALGWAYTKIRIVFWWAFRLHFLTQEDTVLRTYGINDPFKERLHARLTGLCLWATIACAVASYYRFGYEEPAWLFITALCAAAFIALTCIFYLNKLDNPVAHSLEVGGDE